MKRVLFAFAFIAIGVVGFSIQQPQERKETGRVIEYSSCGFGSQASATAAMNNYLVNTVQPHYGTVTTSVVAYNPGSGGSNCCGDYGNTPASWCVTVRWVDFFAV